MNFYSVDVLTRVSMCLMLLLRVHEDIRSNSVMDYSNYVLVANFGKDLSNIQHVVVVVLVSDTFLSVLPFH